MPLLYNMCVFMDCSHAAKGLGMLAALFRLQLTDRDVLMLLEYALKTNKKV